MEEKFKSFLQHDLYFTATVLILVAMASFALGRYSVIPPAGGGVAAQGAALVRYTEALPATTTVAQAATTLPLVPKASSAPVVEGGQFIASKNGTRYYHQSCAGAGRIKTENRVFFETEASAQAAGYTRALHCSYPSDNP